VIYLPIIATGEEEFGGPRGELHDIDTTIMTLEHLQILMLIVDGTLVNTTFVREYIVDVIVYRMCGYGESLWLSVGLDSCCWV